MATVDVKGLNRPQNHRVSLNFTRSDLIRFIPSVIQAADSSPTSWNWIDFKTELILHTFLSCLWRKRCTHGFYHPRCRLTLYIMFCTEGTGTFVGRQLSLSVG